MRKDQAFIDEYKKDASFEGVLQSLNSHLQTPEKAMYQDFAETYSSIHIVGAPRSGTTLLNQLISSCLDVGYINNFIATFFKAPVHGITLSKKLLGMDCPSDFSSDFGKTNSIYEPHEFGYFWADLLKYPEIAQMPAEHEQNIDWPQLRLTLLNMCEAFGSSVVFKSFFLGFHMQKVVQQLPKTLFVYIERDPIENALSLLKMRRQMFSDESLWASIKPLDYERCLTRSPEEQVLWQVEALNQSYKQQIALVPNANVLTLYYDDLCQNPMQVIKQLQQKLQGLAVQQQCRVDAIKPFTASVTASPNKDWDKLQAIINKRDRV